MALVPFIIHMLVHGPEAHAQQTQAQADPSVEAHWNELGIRRRILCEADPLVPAAEDHGGAHGKIKFLFTKFDSRVLVEVHDLLVQVTRPTQVHMLLKVLENQFKRVVGRDAMRDMCCGDIPRRPAHLTSQGMALSQILMCAPAEMRAEGYTAYEEERAASAGSGPSLLVFSEMQRRGDGSSSSSNATGSVASSPGSVTSSKRHSRSGAQASEDAREGA